ncbi:MAG: AAA family ATPase [Acidobacteria bacterium]|nr:AAA family ATPase [Acidobacteriota bacterium]MBU4307535.1 AAA family ATPase [Acidobacteriota bacterium]MBU4405010.1 AAA family ATPase [Acidobacteriota bacterium]MCG2810918.1 AAA family ATPase [Candidatus Aminicenantes bacterium]
MKRDIFQALLDWKVGSNRKPILMRGARQVGKSWLAKEFGKTFPNYIEVNFEKNPEICGLFQGDLEPRSLCRNLANYLGKEIKPGQSLLFLDEIQNCPRAITALRYFYEEMPELHVISAGSLLEFELRNIAIPVGRIHVIQVYPLSFAEFLEAGGNGRMRNMLLENRYVPLQKPFHEKLLSEVKNYCMTGGMPEVVQNHVNGAGLEKCLEIQSDMLHTLRTDFHKYARESQLKYMEQVFNSIPLQLGGKFKYSRISQDTRSKFYREALTLLEMAGLAYKVCHTSANGIPLGAEVNPDKFKVLLFDIGLAQRLMKLDYKSLLLKTDLMGVNHGTMAELFVGLELIAYVDFRQAPSLFYWHREAKSSNAEVDYVISSNERIIPVEVKSGTTGRMKSLRLFMEQKRSTGGVRICESGFASDQKIQSIPLYAVEALIKDHSWLS